MREAGAWRTALLLLPALALVAGLFGTGVVLGAAESFGIGHSDGFTLRHYIALFSDREFIVAFRLTLTIALTATALAAIGGLGLALAMRRLRALRVLAQIPLALPHLAMAFFLIQVLSPSGLLARLFYGTGLISGSGDFPEWVQDRWGIGIVLTYACKELPFVALMLLPSLLRVDREYGDVARSLGANRWQSFVHVTLPLLMPALGSACIFVFAYVFSAYEVPFVMGRPYPAMLSVVAQKRYLLPDLAVRPNTVAMACVMSAISALITFVYLRLSSRWQRGSALPALY